MLWKKKKTSVFFRKYVFLEKLRFRGKHCSRLRSSVSHCILILIYFLMIKLWWHETCCTQCSQKFTACVNGHRGFWKWAFWPGSLDLSPPWKSRKCLFLEYIFIYVATPNVYFCSRPYFHLCGYPKCLVLEHIFIYVTTPNVYF